VEGVLSFFTVLIVETSGDRGRCNTWAYVVLHRWKKVTCHVNSRLYVLTRLDIYVCIISRVCVYAYVCMLSCVCVFAVVFMCVCMLSCVCVYTSTLENDIRRTHPHGLEITSVRYGRCGRLGAGQCFWVNMIRRSKVLKERSNCFDSRPLGRWLRVIGRL
jgi:hypothetical protein